MLAHEVLTKEKDAETELGGVGIMRLISNQYSYWTLILMSLSVLYVAEIKEIIFAEYKWSS